MENIYDNVLELMGNTPLVRLHRIEKEYGIEGRLLAKLESFNPARSIKDRIAIAMIDKAEKDGILKPGGTIIEPTSGNTGIALSLVAAAKGYKAVIVMPASMSVERRKLIAGFGAKVVLTPAAEGMKGAIKKASELQNEIDNSFIPGQFFNEENPKIHRNTTGPEIWEDTDNDVDIFVAGVGTGGTITGAGGYLKEKNKNIKIVAIEPKESPVLSKGQAGSHKIQGIGAGFIPEVLDSTVYDEIVRVAGNDAYAMAGKLAKTEGILAGISSGAALYGAVKTATQAENKGKTTVVILPDTGERYLSTGVFGDVLMPPEPF